MCGWGFGPIAYEHSLRVGRRELKLRRVIRTSQNSLRVIFAHRVTVSEDDGGLYRAIFNRGRATVTIGTGVRVAARATDRGQAPPAARRES